MFLTRAHPFRILVSTLLVLALAACVGRRVVVERTPDKSGDGVASTEVREAFVSALDHVANIDSLAVWLNPDGMAWLIATAKDTAQLVVFDAETGVELQRIGRAGKALGEFARPNGIAIFGDTLFVAERDNGRVQVLGLPDFESLGSFGEGDLVTPYGLWVRETAPLELEVYVTDSYQSANGAPPPLELLNRRVKTFRVLLDDFAEEANLDARLTGTFGATDPAGAVRWIESIAGDETNNRLLIPEEYIADAPGALRLYDLDGEFLGRNIGEGLFGGQPEGLALYACADGSGYWIAADQQEHGNRFHVFERDRLDYLGTFGGAEVRFTDGVALNATPSERFPAGAFYAVHADSGVAAFDWRDIASALNLRERCPD
jgi:3-phytase